MSYTDNKFQEAKRRLSDLRAESNDLPRALAAALTAGETNEVSRLRERQKELPERIREAELDVTGLKVAKLRAAQAERINLLEQEQATSKETDEIVTPKIAELNDEIKRLKDEAHAALIRVYRLKGEIQQGAIELQAAEQEFKRHLEQAIPALV
jgi:chromosome segregation ATPase